MVVRTICGALGLSLFSFLPTIRAYHSKMGSQSRYFVNPYDDYKGGDVEMKTEVLQDRLKSVVHTIVDNQTRKLSDCDGGLYVGLSGIAYAFYYLSTLPALASEKDENLKRASDYISIALQYSHQSADVRHDPKTEAGFLLGDCGVNTVAAMIYHALGYKDQYQKLVKSVSKRADTLAPIHFLKHGSDEMFVGRAGFLTAILTLRKAFKAEIMGQEIIEKLCSVMIQSGRDYSQRLHSQSPLMYAYYDTEYLGAAHGISAILQVLLCFPEYVKDHPDAEKEIRAAVDFLLGLQMPNGNFPCAMDEVRRRRSESDELVHWCHGAPGVVFLMAKAYLFWKDDRYLQSCIKCGDVVWQKGLLRKGPGICHGVAGNGYVFLLLYRLTSDKKYLYRAQRFCDFIFTDEFRRNARTPDHPYSLYEGLAGTACFLADLHAPEHAAFPFFDIF